jgi:tetratricopeptide (TPR) repeat protein
MRSRPAAHRVDARCWWVAAVRSSLALLVAVSVEAAPLFAAPYTPKRYDDVLLVLPRRIRSRSVETLKGILAANPGDADVAARLAEAYLASGRLEADPRLYGMAEAALAPWAKDDTPPFAVLKLRAEIEGYNHSFAAALRDYDRLVASASSAVQKGPALLARSVLRAVTGDLEAAAADCKALDVLGAGEQTAYCRLNLAVASGSGAAALANLRDEAETSWATELLGEAAAQAGDVAAAERFFKQAVAEAPGNVFNLCAYADFLLSVGRPGDLLLATPSATTNVGLMVRQAAALRRLAAPTAEDAARLQNLVSQLEVGFAVEAERGSAVHGRELALFALTVQGHGAEALAVAKENWSKQREPLDAALLFAAAHLQNDAETKATLLASLQKTGVSEAAWRRFKMTPWTRR